MHIIFLLEEPSMKILPDIILPNIIPDGTTYQTIKHEGKSDLDRSIPIKLRAIRTPNTAFVILRDKDSADCKLLKQRLVNLCTENGRPDTLVRIVCHELESWFLGDLSAIEQAYGLHGLSRWQNKAKDEVYRKFYLGLIEQPLDDSVRLLDEVIDDEKNGDGGNYSGSDLSDDGL